MPKTPVDDLLDRAEALRLRWLIVFGNAWTGDADARRSWAEWLEDRLRAADPEAVKIAHAVVDVADLVGTQFWCTPLGRLLFAAGGYADETIGQSFAAGILDCSRQRVSQLVAAGRLSRGAGSLVLVGEVQELLRAKLDMTVKEV